MATSPFNAQLRRCKLSSNQHITANYVTSLHGSRGGGDSAGVADSVRGRYAHEQFNFRLQTPCASKHSLDNPMCLITIVNAPAS